MAAYVVFTRERTRDDDEMHKYAAQAVPTLRDQPVRQLAFYGALSVLEGRALEGAAILEFPSVQAAREWYDSAADQAALPHRKSGADYGVFIVDGMEA